MQARAAREGTSLSDLIKRELERAAERREISTRIAGRKMMSRWPILSGMTWLDATVHSWLRDIEEKPVQRLLTVAQPETRYTRR